MSTLTRDQIRHEVINLQKMVKWLERTVDDEDWTTSTAPDCMSKWLKSQTVLRGVKQCRSVLKAVPPEVYEEGLGQQRATSGEQFHEDTVQVLNRLELSMKDASLEFKPQTKKPTPRLPNLPLPKSLSKTPAPRDEEKATIQEDTDKLLSTRDESPDSLTTKPPLFEAVPDTLPSADKISALLPPSFPSLSSPPAIPNSTSTSAIMQTSTALQDDLANELAQLARQLKENTIHFSSSLSKDKAVMKEVEEKLERNADVLGERRVRLRDHRGKSGNTTWIVFLSIIVVMIGFFMTFFVIRIT